MGEIEESIKGIREKIEEVKKKSEMQKHLEEIREKLEKIEKEPGKRKGLDSCHEIEKREVLWPSFEALE